jgi:hypothetical protein
MNYNLPRGFCDGMDGELQEEIQMGMRRFENQVVSLTSIAVAKLIIPALNLRHSSLFWVGWPKDRG